ncbi:MAG: cation-translocating P-type ATPase, partial [Pseudomonadota bacterium]
ARFGPNTLPERGGQGLLGVVLGQFRSPLIYVLLAAAAVSAALGHGRDAVFIAVILIINAAIGALQESRAERSAAALKASLKLMALVLRDGARRTAEADDLVPGDVVLLESGMATPADLRLLSAHQLRVDESLLTGESALVEKSADWLGTGDETVGDRRNMVFAGSAVLAGRGVGVVCATGEATQIGQVAGLLSGRDAPPPLLVRMEVFSRRIALAILALVLALGLLHLARGAELAEVFLTATALAVSAIPEGLPVAITVALAVASLRMSRRNVVVRRLPAVEGLGSCTVIASDKTGTLTINRLTVTRIVTPDGTGFTVGGEGLGLEGAIEPIGEAAGSAAAWDSLRRLAQAAARANEAVMKIDDGAVEASGDPVDVAFKVLGAKLRGAAFPPGDTGELISRIPYEPERGFCAAAHRCGEGARLSVKGAPERILAMCPPEARAEALAEAEALAAEGYRVIAVAERMLGRPDDRLEPALEGLEFLGLAGLIDPLRPEAFEAVALCRSAGVEVRMVTGDHPATASAIARRLGMAAPEEVLTGRELAALTEPALSKRISEARIFARVEPAQKTLIVQALQDAGHFVAVTGDGVNDAPALKTAHVGVAMGASGSDVARGAADLILVDDNFASIVAGVEEGRAAYDNIRKIIWMLISTAIAEVALVALALLFDLPIPLTAVQILWLNLVTNGVQDIALAFERREPDAMARPPRPPGQPIFDRRMIGQCATNGLYAGVLGFGLFAALLFQGWTEAEARNLTLLFMVFFENVHVLNCRSETRSLFRIPLRANPWVLAAVAAAQALHVAAMYTPGVRGVLGVAPVAPAEWLMALSLAASVVLVAEAHKAVARRIDPHQGAAVLARSG